MSVCPKLRAQAVSRLINPGRIVSRTSWLIACSSQSTPRFGAAAVFHVTLALETTPAYALPPSSSGSPPCNTQDGNQDQQVRMRITQHLHLLTLVPTRIYGSRLIVAVRCLVVVCAFRSGERVVRSRSSFMYRNIECQAASHLWILYESNTRRRGAGSETMPQPLPAPCVLTAQDDAGAFML